MRTFPKFFRLPSSVLDLIISSLSPLELLELSQCSSKTHAILKNSIIAEGPVKLTFVINHSTLAGCRIENFRGKQQKLMIWIDEVGQWIRRAGECRVQQFFGRTWTMRKTDDEVQIIVTANALELAAWFADSLFDFFQVKPANFDLSVWLNPESFPAYQEWGGAKKSRGMLRFYESYDSASLAKYLEYHGETKRKFFFCGKISDSENLSPAHFPALDVFLMKARHFGTDVLFNLDARAMIILYGEYSRNPPIFSRCLKHEHINMFLKKWLEDVEFHKNLEILMFGSQWRRREFSEDDLYKDIPLMESNGAPPTKRQQEDLTIAQIEIPEGTKGWDVRRAADGKVATLFLTNKALIFVVRP